MNIYDFDNTIFKGDSSVKFIKYSLIRHPFIVTISIFKGFKEGLKYAFKKSNLGLVKSELFSFVKNISNFDEYMHKYVLRHQKNIKKFYLEQKKDNDVIISASFDFIIKPFCESLGIKNVVATKYDVRKGHIIGVNCKGAEKVKRFNEQFKNVKVDKAYSDSLSDIPMFTLAKKAYLVKGEKLSLYQK